MIPHKCPVCDGQGIVSKPPYIAGDQQTWPSNGTTTYPCPVCAGVKILWEKEEKMNLTKKQEDSFSDTVLTINISLENAIEWIARNMNPDDVFSEHDLEIWASTSGYIKEKSNE